MTRRYPVDPKRAAPATEADHPAADRWWACATGTIGRAEARRLEAHRLACAVCARRAAGAERLAGARAALELEAPPAAARRRARELFTARRATPTPQAKSVSTRVPARRLPAFARLRLVRGLARGAFAAATGTGGAAFATRRAAAEPLRRCALEGGTWRLELEWTSLDRAWAIRGRIVDLRAPGARGGAPAMRLEAADGAARAVAIGPRGFFGPVRVPAPELRVTLEDADRSFRSPWLPRAPRSRR